MSASNTPNVAALASPIYNPDIDDVTLKIFSVMHNDYPQALIDQYRQIIVSMPTENPFSAVLTNPRSCEISQAQTTVGEIKNELNNQFQKIISAGISIPANTPRLGVTISQGTNVGGTLINGVVVGGVTTGGTAFTSDNRPITGGTITGGTTINGVTTGGTMIGGNMTGGTTINGVTTGGSMTGGTTATTLPGDPGYNATAQQAIDSKLVQQASPQLNSNLDQVGSNMDNFQNHTDRLISNFPNILGMIQTGLGVASVVGKLLDPCLGLNDFLGSLLGAGSGIMKKINAALAEVKAFIEAGLQHIQQAIAQIQALIAKALAYVQSLIAMVEKEIMKLIKSLIDAARLGLAQLLSLLPKDPCFKAVLNALGSGPVLGAVAGLAK